MWEVEVTLAVMCIISVCVGVVLGVVATVVIGDWRDR